MFPTLVDSLFHQPIRQFVDFLFEADVALGEDAATVGLFAQVLSSRFQLHNASNFLPPLLRPKSGVFDSGGTLAAEGVRMPVELLGSNGLVLLLPVELCVPLARHVARLRTPRLKRQAIGHVFLPSPISSSQNSAAYQHPAQRTEMNYDIIDNRQSAVPTIAAECISVAADAAAALQPMLVGAGFDPRISIGDSKLCIVLLEMCGVSDPAVIRDLVRSLGMASEGATGGGGSMETKAWAVAANFNRDAFRLLFGNSALPMDPLQAITELEGRLEGVRQLQSEGRRQRRLADEAAVRLRVLRSTMEVLWLIGLYETDTPPSVYSWSASAQRSFGRKTHFRFELGLCDRHGVFTSGVIFHVVLAARPDQKERKAAPTVLVLKVAEGGQYDHLLSAFRQPPLQRGDPSVGFGVRIPLERLALGRPKAMLAAPTKLNESSLVLVVSLVDGGEERNPAAEMLWIAQILWSSGICADHRLPHWGHSPSVDKIVAEARSRGVGHLVFVKPHALHRDLTVRLLSIKHGSSGQRVVHINELCKRILGRQDPDGPAAVAASSAAASESSPPAANHDARSSGVVFLSRLPDHQVAAVQRRATQAAASLETSSVIVIEAPLMALRRIATVFMSESSGDREALGQALGEFSRYAQDLRALHSKLQEASEEWRRQPRKSGAPQHPSPVLIYSSMDSRFDIVYLEAAEASSRSKPPRAGPGKRADKRHWKMRP